MIYFFSIWSATCIVWLRFENGRSGKTYNNLNFAISFENWEHGEGEIGRGMSHGPLYLLKPYLNIAEIYLLGAYTSSPHMVSGRLYTFLLLSSFQKTEDFVAAFGSGEENL